jgi:hypothetical protein
MQRGRGCSKQQGSEISLEAAIPREQRNVELGGLGRLEERDEEVQRGEQSCGVHAGQTRGGVGRCVQLSRDEGYNRVIAFL